jgi:hypothetical protein
MELAAVKDGRPDRGSAGNEKKGTKLAMEGYWLVGKHA